MKQHEHEYFSLLSTVQNSPNPSVSVPCAKSPFCQPCLRRKIKSISRQAGRRLEGTLPVCCLKLRALRLKKYSYIVNIPSIHSYLVYSLHINNSIGNYFNTGTPILKCLPFLLFLWLLRRCPDHTLLCLIMSVGSIY